ncbi:thermonuclease family protein [bacterium]|nr:thermonuclease family protein [bacterium]
MKNTIIFAILFSLVIILTATQVTAKKAYSKSYTCISAENGIFLISDSQKTNKFKLYGVIFPTKKTLNQFAKKSNTKAKDLTYFLPKINNQLNKYAGKTVKIKNNFGKNLWLEDADGNSINLEVVENGIALPVKNVKRQYKKQFEKVKIEAIKNAVGIWALYPDNNPMQDVRIEYSSKNIIKDKKSSSQKYSASSYIKNKSWNNLREITLNFNTFYLNRKIDLVIKYQFKLTNYGSKRKISRSSIKKKYISLFPPDDIKIIIKSPEVLMRKYSNSDAASSSVSGKDYAGDVVVIYYKDEIVFKHGELK